jgi:hypothetical protein
MAESERVSSDPKNLLVNTSVGMWFWISNAGNIQYRPGIAFLRLKKSPHEKNCARYTHESFPSWRRGRENE